MDLKYWAATDVGRKRTHNEDNFLIDQQLRLFIVADGMGGHASGEVASAMAVHTIRNIVHRELDLLENPVDDPAWHMEVCMLLEYAVHMACEQIFRKGVQEPEKKGMGTTVVALLIVEDRGYIAYVGDSRIYLLRGGIVYQLTEDHSLMNELIRQGKITAEDFDDSPYAQFKHAMTRAVGPQEIVEVDTLDFDMIPGDAFLLCSDGLYEYTDDSDISRMLSLTEIKDIPGRLIDLANTRGGKDNITALVIQVPENADGSDRAAEINFTLDTLKNIPLFAQLTYQQLVRIMNLTRVIPFEEGSVLCHEGHIGDELFVILRGEVELSNHGQPLTTLKQGEYFGEMALIDAAPRNATATALGEGKLLTINSEDFYEILRKEAPLAVKLLWSFVQELNLRLRQTSQALSTVRPVEAPAEVEEIEEIEDLSDELMPSESSTAMSRAALRERSGVPTPLGAAPTAQHVVGTSRKRTTTARKIVMTIPELQNLDERDEDRDPEAPQPRRSPDAPTPRRSPDAPTPRQEDGVPAVATAARHASATQAPSATAEPGQPEAAAPTFTAPKPAASPATKPKPKPKPKPAVTPTTSVTPAASPKPKPSVQPAPLTSTSTPDAPTPAASPKPAAKPKPAAAPQATPSPAPAKVAAPPAAAPAPAAAAPAPKPAAPPPPQTPSTDDDIHTRATRPIDVLQDGAPLPPDIHTRATRPIDIVQDAPSFGSEDDEDDGRDA
ncbi:cyclic nucleotide-binding domain-containing protein [Pseudenhygromyxa sp. WMMC2535]|uniref:cyclic nucleotide-binding domain-containing protein n=1 Tax=Pseudenhygromyxa sp. WMMC2535 TaxID=2712867 RepID=UPI001554B13A|nr:cyclic nucleotide-binding domain-containing protein [Pseudenhygromyxa sp. WMMC2535]NVB42234.1 cyclic nucleotide-binding domain-containing protein [Pseudenhygromyxa sp. WMMC2535]